MTIHNVFLVVNKIIMEPGYKVKTSIPGSLISSGSATRSKQYFSIVKSSIMDNKNKKDYRDRVRININEKYEVQYWSKHFNVTPAKLKKAVNEVGVTVKKVKAHLGE